MIQAMFYYDDLCTCMYYVWTPNKTVSVVIDHFRASDCIGRAKEGGPRGVCRGFLTLDGVAARGVLAACLEEERPAAAAAAVILVGGGVCSVSVVTWQRREQELQEIHAQI